MDFLNVLNRQKSNQLERTPFYYYDLGLLRATLSAVVSGAKPYSYDVHYALKANANPRILSEIVSAGLGADCVSGGEIRAALAAGFPAEKIAFAGVGKSDWEIIAGLESGIMSFNVESLAELRVINAIASERNVIAPIALRINPDVDAHTHAKITTGTSESKFGISMRLLPAVLDLLPELSHVIFKGLHFHIGSQITDMSIFEHLAARANELQEIFESRGIFVPIFDFGGGLGIDYQDPDRNLIPDFAGYFSAYHRAFRPRPGQRLHFEPGRSIVAQCGTLISRVLYVKESDTRRYVILDAGFTDLLRPAMYDAYHHIENLTSSEPIETYDVAGPICESADIFGRDVRLNRVRRGDLLAIRSAGAYGEVMSSRYNQRALPGCVFSEI